MPNYTIFLSKNKICSEKEKLKGMRYHYVNTFVHFFLKQIQRFFKVAIDISW